MCSIIKHQNIELFLQSNKLNTKSLVLPNIKYTEITVVNLTWFAFARFIQLRWRFFVKMCRGSVWPWPLGMAGQRSNLKWGELAPFQDESIHILCRLLSTRNTYYIIYPRVHKSTLRDD